MQTSQHIFLLHNFVGGSTAKRAKQMKKKQKFVPGTVAAAVGRTAEAGGAMSNPLTRLL
jgi:hypothetical protein